MCSGILLSRRTGGWRWASLGGVACEGNRYFCWFFQGSAWTKSIPKSGPRLRKLGFWPKLAGVK